MRTTLNLELVIRRRDAESDSLYLASLDVEVVYGRPTAADATNAEYEIPLTVRDVRLDGVVQGWNMRETIIECLGGRQGLRDLCDNLQCAPILTQELQTSTATIIRSEDC